MESFIISFAVTFIISFLMIIIYLYTRNSKDNFEHKQMMDFQRNSADDLRKLYDQASLREEIFNELDQWSIETELQEQNIYTYEKTKKVKRNGITVGYVKNYYMIGSEKVTAINKEHQQIVLAAVQELNEKRKREAEEFMRKARINRENKNSSTKKIASEALSDLESKFKNV